MRRSKLIAILIGTVVALPLGLSLQSSASADKPKPYQGYSIVTSAAVVAARNTQTFGTVACSGKAVAVGGGVIIDSGRVTENVNGTQPVSKTTWGAYVNNTSRTTDGSFRVYAVCVKKVTKYQVVVNQQANPGSDAAQTDVAATCPAGTVVLGGGGLGQAEATTQNLASSFPSGNGWRVRAVYSNIDNDDFRGVFVYAVCGAQPAGYSVVTGPTVSNGPGAHTLASAPCAEGSLPVGGGVSTPLVGPRGGSVLLGGTFPSGSSWSSYENNTTRAAASLTPYAICASAS